MNMYEFYTGRYFDAYKHLGCHILGDGRTAFRVFAPNATGVVLIGNFNNWEGSEMHQVYDGKIWEIILDTVKPGDQYKYRIYTRNGDMTERCDPYGFGMELRPQSASVVRDLNIYEWHDSTWMNKRTDCKDKALNIYEVHAGSWKRKSDEDEEGWYSYTEIADLLIPYVKEQGYNYVEFMPLGEHPSDNSWGYQQTGFFAPTSRYGTMDDLKQMVDKFHQNNIGLILDFVPVHFAVDGYSLAKFDGTSIYEYPHKDVGYSEWGSMNFNHCRGEVQSFLESCANYWLAEYHFDGLRMDAIRNILYWQGDEKRGANKNALGFVQTMNAGLKARNKGVILAAEDSSSYTGLTKPVFDGGLGFDYKWDMGWMNDTLQYFQEFPDKRIGKYHKLTFSMMYYYNDYFMLPLSHDEVVHGKATILQKMNGDYDMKFPQARALYMYMYAHPGKKLNFMGNELGQLREWDEKREQDWLLMLYPKHVVFNNFIKKLNHLYLDHSAFYEGDYTQDGFMWRDCNRPDRCVYAIERRSSNERLLFVFNFSDYYQENYDLFFNEGEKLELLLDTNAPEYGGNPDKPTTATQYGNKYEFKLAPLSGVCYKIV